MMLHADVVGQGPALVLLHGFTGNTSSWDAARRGHAAGFRTIAVDLPGHGRSPAPAAGTDLAGLADALVAVLDRLGVARAHWLGYSLGGRAALHVAHAHPDRVDRLVLVGASPGLDEPGLRELRAAADAALADRIERDGLEAFVERWTALPLFWTQARLPAEARAALRATRLANTAPGLAAALRAFGVGTQPSLWRHLGALAAPTLLVAGALDHRYRALASDVRIRMPRASVAVVAEAGHAAHFESPAAFWAAASTFLGAPPAA